MRTGDYTTFAPPRSESRARVRRRLAEARQAVVRDPRCASSLPAHFGHSLSQWRCCTASPKWPFGPRRSISSDLGSAVREIAANGDVEKICKWRALFLYQESVTAADFLDLKKREAKLLAHMRDVQLRHGITGLNQ